MRLYALHAAAAGERPGPKVRRRRGPAGCRVVAALGALAVAVGVSAAAPPAPVDVAAARYVELGCGGCHALEAQADGGALPTALAARVRVLAATPAGRRYLVAAVAFGLVSPPGSDGLPYGAYMPGNPQLADADVARTLNWLARTPDARAGDARYFNADAVRAARRNPASPEQVQAWRDDLSGRAGASVPARPLRAATDLRDPDDIRGPQVAPRARYLLDCAGCHGMTGEARVTDVPAVRNFMGYFTHTPRGREYLVRIPGSTNSLLSSADLAAVLNWMLESFSRAQLVPGFKPYTEAEIQRLRAKPLVLDAGPERAALVSQLRRAGVIPLSVQADRNDQSNPPSPDHH